MRAIQREEIAPETVAKGDGLVGDTEIDPEVND
jgi:hypothetical protein